MASTTKPPPRYGPAIDASDLASDLAQIDTLRRTDPPTKWAAIARILDCSIGQLARLRKLELVKNHDEAGRFVVWLSSHDVGGEIRLVGKVKGTTTFQSSSAARWQTRALAQNWITENRHDKRIGGNVAPGQFNPFVVDLDGGA